MYHGEAVASHVGRGRSPDRLMLSVSESEGLPMRVLSAHDRGWIESDIFTTLSSGEQVSGE